MTPLKKVIKIYLLKGKIMFLRKKNCKNMKFNKKKEGFFGANIRSGVVVCLTCAYLCGTLEKKVWDKPKEVKKLVIGYRFQVTLAWPVRDRMDVLAKELGMSRSALITMLLNEKWKEAGHTDEEIRGKNDE